MKYIKSVNEIFGFSKGEKSSKKLKLDIKKAKKEVDDIDLSALWRQTSNDTDNETYKILINIIVGNLKERMPTFLKLFPEILDGIKKDRTNASVSRYDYNGKVLNGITLSTLSHFLTPKTTDNIDEASRENMKMRLDELSK